MGYHGFTRFRILPDKMALRMVAWPVSYGQTGVMSFVVNQDDRVHRANLRQRFGAKAQALATATRIKPGSLSPPERGA